MTKPGPPRMQLNDARIKALAGKISDKKLAKIIGCHKDTIKARRHELGIPGSLKHYDWPRIFEALKSGLPVRQAVAPLGHTSKCDLVVIRQMLREKGIVYNKRLNRIPEPTKIQLARLIEFHDMPRQEAAKLIGVSVKTVKKWKERYNCARLRATGQLE